MTRKLAVPLPPTLAVALLLCAAHTFGQAAGTDANSPRFEVASIKRNIDTRPQALLGTLRSGPGETRLAGIPVRLLLLRAYPVKLPPPLIEGLPGWADSERYDVDVKARPDATPEEQRVMWQAFFAERMKLAAHYQRQQRPVYNLVVARPGVLGPQLKPSTLDCPPLEPGARPEPPPAEVTALMLVQGPLSDSQERLIMARCRSTFYISGTTYAGAVDMNGVLMALRLSGANVLDRPVIDHTGLQGLYAMKLTFSRAPRSAADAPDDAPSIFTALPEQLGLKLERGTVDDDVLVIDHIERPTPD